MNVENIEIVDYLIYLVGPLTTGKLLVILCVMALPLTGVVTPLTDQVPRHVTLRFT